MITFVLGSAPDAAQAADWTTPVDANLVAINNAWRIRPDWNYLVHAGDFPEERRPTKTRADQRVLSYETYVPAQNRYGGFVYAGGTMAFTAGYWALDALKPKVLAFFGCDMVYAGRNTHFYGKGEADPLRDDITLRSLEAKSARLFAFAARQNCSCVNLSTKSESRLVFPRITFEDLSSSVPLPKVNDAVMDKALEAELSLGYLIEDGEYWHHLDTFDADALAEVDDLWLSSIEV